MKNLHPRTKLAALFATICLAPAPVALAVDPPPDGGYPNGNTAEGEDALFSLTTGLFNTAVGFQALYGNATGSENTAIGRGALASNTAGGGNTATGESTLNSNTTGFLNTATGDSALRQNSTGFSNTAVGWAVLASNTTGSNNTASGLQALDRNTTGNLNTASGNSALSNNTTGNNNTVVGSFAGSSLTTGSNNIDIGNAGVADESGIIRIGVAGTQTAAYISGIRETPLAHGVAVAVGVTADGQLGVRASSARFKEAIKPMDKASEAIFSLQPVTFRYKKALDPTALPQFGLVAEEVAKIDPDLVAIDAEGKPYAVRYEEVNVMLLNEFLKEHRKVEEQTAINQRQEATIAQQQKNIEALTAALKTQATQIQEVSDQLKTQAPRVVAND